MKKIRCLLVWLLPLVFAVSGFSQNSVDTISLRYIGTTGYFHFKGEDSIEVEWWCISSSGEIYNYCREKFPSNRDGCLKNYPTETEDTLQVFFYSSNKLQSLDVTEYYGNIHWADDTADMRISDYRIHEVDVSRCTSLKNINCRNNRLRSLDVSGCTSLMSLSCSNNQLSSLDMSGCASLASLSCGNNQLSSLDVSGCVSLTNLDCGNNQLSSLDVSGCVSLTNLDCGNNQLSSLDVSGCASLVRLFCDENQLSSLDVSGCTLLKKLENVTADTLRIYGESMDTLTLTIALRGNPYYKIGVLDAAGCTTLRQITCTYGGIIRRLNLQGCTSLTSLDYHSDYLSSLDVSGCTSLTSLDCHSIQLSSLDVSGCTSLTSLDCAWNQLSSLNVSGCTSLTSLDCAWNQLSSLNVSGCTSLTSLDCHSNQLSSLDVRGFTSLTNLNCGSNYLLNNLDVSSCTALVNLNCNNATDYYSKGNLRSLDVSKNTLLESLDCAGNQLRSIDVSKNKLLSSLNCGYNRIPLSVLYKAYSQNSNWERFAADSQSDSITVLINRPFDLSSERIVGQTLTTFKLTDAYGQELPSDFWTENRFVFQFHEPINYKMELHNNSISTATYDGDRIANFIWYISVVADMPVRYFTVHVFSNNAGWGTATITGNGTYEEGTEVTITAKANAGYCFVNWTRKDGSVFSTEEVHTFAVTENLELTANFERNVANESHGNDDFYVYVQEHTIHLSADRGLVQVYSATGVCVYSGHATVIPVKSSGLYIVRAGERAYKVIVR